MMQHPVLALAWQSWRLMRRQYLLSLLIISALAWVMMTARPSMMPEDAPYELMLATPAFMLIFAFAGICTLLAITLGNKHGFPFAFEYRMPVHTSILVCVPMLFIAVLCASFFFIPLTVLGLIFDIPFPLFAGSTLIASAVILMLSGSWSTSSTGQRGFALPFSMALMFSLVNWFEPFNVRTRGRPGDPFFNDDILTLSGIEYAILLTLVLLMLRITTSSIACMRVSEPLHIGKRKTASLPAAGADSQRLNLVGLINKLMDRISERLGIQCPTRAAWQAEVWCEYRRFALPTLVLSLAICIGIPVLLLFGRILNWRGVLDISNATPLVVYFTAIGTTLFNRRMAHGGYMNVFEGSRAMSTLQLASIQLLTLATSIAVGITLVKGSLALTQPLAATVGTGKPVLQLGSLLAELQDASLLYTLNNHLMELVIFFSIIMMFFCLHTCSALWGKKFLIGAAILVFYCINFIFRIRSESATLDTIINHMWGVSWLIALVTLLSLYGVMRRAVVTPRVGVLMMLGTLVLIVLGAINLEQLGYDYSEMAPELLALNIALLALPLTFAALTLWGYDKLRHS